MCGATGLMGKAFCARRFIAAVFDKAGLDNPPPAMSLKFLFVLVLLAFTVVFSAQNAAVVNVRFLGWSLEVSQALVIFLSVFAGIMIGSIATLLTRRKAPKPPESGPPQ